MNTKYPAKLFGKFLQLINWLHPMHCILHPRSENYAVNMYKKHSRTKFLRHALAAILMKNGNNAAIEFTTLFRVHFWSVSEFIQSMNQLEIRVVIDHRNMTEIGHAFFWLYSRGRRLTVVIKTLKKTSKSVRRYMKSWGLKKIKKFFFLDSTQIWVKRQEIQ